MIIPHRIYVTIKEISLLTFILFGMSLFNTPRAEIVGSFLETFSLGNFDHTPWQAMNAGSSLTLLPTSSDRNLLDEYDDGSLLIERSGGVTGIYGVIRSLGVVDTGDIGKSIIIDFAYERPDDNFGSLKPLLLIDGTIVAEGSTVSLFNSGEDPSAAEGIYSAVKVPLGYRVVADDLGKEMSVRIQYYDGNVSQNRNLILDAVNFINTGDELHIPEPILTFSGAQAEPAYDLLYLRRIDPKLPALNYITEVSDNLEPWSWRQATTDDVASVPLDNDYEQVTQRLAVEDSMRKFYRVAIANKRIGDPGLSFDANKMDPNFPQMLEWQGAGVQGGIPFRTQYPVLKVITETNSAGINTAINEIAAQATSLGGGCIVLRDGNYTIDAEIMMQNNIRLLGESRDGVLLSISMTTETDPQASAVAFQFSDIQNAGLDNLTIKGAHGAPDPSLMENAKPEFRVNSVNFYYSSNCWLDDVNIIDSGNHAISSWRSSHVTVRGCTIDGSWNKGGGGSGYFLIQSDRFLIVDNHVRSLRHIALQKQHCEYNVVLRNFFEQDVNFHDDDNGNNLIEGNRIILSAALGSGWHPVMGPWSSQHTKSRNDNYIFNNKCKEINNGNLESFSDSTKVYLGSRNHEQDGNVFVESNQLPSAGTFYPVIISP